MFIVAKQMDEDVTWYGGRPRPGHIVLDGDPALPKEVHVYSSSLLFGPYLLWPKGCPSQLLHAEH